MRVMIRPESKIAGVVRRPSDSEARKSDYLRRDTNDPLRCVSPDRRRHCRVEPHIALNEKASKLERYPNGLNRLGDSRIG